MRNALEEVFRRLCRKPCPAPHIRAGKISGEITINQRVVTPSNLARTLLAERTPAAKIAKTIFEAIADPIFVIDFAEDGLAPHFSYVNEATCRILNHTREDLVKMKPGTVDDLDPVTMETAYEQLVTLGQATFETRLIAADGVRIPVEIHASVAQIAGRKVCVAVSRSLAARKEMETRIREAAAAADAANRAKSEFVAMMSHEIRTPLHGVIGFASLLESEELPAHVHETVEGIRDSANLLHALVTDILDFSRIETGRLALQIAPVDLAALLRRVQSSFKLRAAQKGIAFHYIESPALPPLALADSLRTHQVVGNLLGNALKFTERGSITLEVAASPDHPEISFIVSDTGIGIRPDQLPKLFKPFSQADPLVFQKYGGSGLGLVIVKRLCELMGGSVSVQSEAGKGSVFTASLTAPPIGATEGNGRSAAPASTASSVSSLRLLVAEDNPVNRKLVGRMIERLGCSARMATNGREAFEFVEKDAYDLILMDVNMPVLDGIAATRAIRSREQTQGRPPVKIVALTAGISEEERRACTEAGMDDFLGKPFTIDGLHATLKRTAQAEAG